MLGNELGKPVEIASRALVARQRNEWSGEYGTWITERDPDPDGSHVHTEPAAGSRIPETRLVRTGRRHRQPASLTGLRPMRGAAPRPRPGCRPGCCRRPAP